MEAELQSRTISWVPGPAGSAGFKSPARLSIGTWALSAAWLAVNPHYEGSLSAPVLTNKSDRFSGKYRHKITAAILLSLCFLCLSWHNQPTNYIIIHFPSCLKSTAPPLTLYPDEAAGLLISAHRLAEMAEIECWGAVGKSLSVCFKALHWPHDWKEQKQQYSEYPKCNFTKVSSVRYNLLLELGLEEVEQKGHSWDLWDQRHVHERAPPASWWWTLPALLRIVTSEDTMYTVRDTAFVMQLPLRNPVESAVGWLDCVAKLRCGISVCNETSCFSKSLNLWLTLQPLSVIQAALYLL